MIAKMTYSQQVAMVDDVPAKDEALTEKVQGWPPLTLAILTDNLYLRTARLTTVFGRR
jgi:hypothetical protein